MSGRIIRAHHGHQLLSFFGTSITDKEDFNRKYCEYIDEYVCRVAPHHYRSLCLKFKKTDALNMYLHDNEYLKEPHIREAMNKDIELTNKHGVTVLSHILLGLYDDFVEYVENKKQEKE
jgi:hypothetical protein